MNIEIYGIDEADFRCGGCRLAKQLFDEAGLNYTFNKVLIKDKDGFPYYEKEVIEKLAKRAKFSSLRIAYPVIFIDNVLINIKNLREFLIEAGYDVEE